MNHPRVLRATVGETMTEQQNQTAIGPAIPGRTENILRAVAVAAAHLLHAHTWQECIDHVAAGLGQATGSEYVYLLQIVSPGPPPTLRVRSFWHAPGIQSPIPFEQLPVDEWLTSTFAACIEQLRRRQTVSGSLQAYTVAQRDALQELGVYFLHLLPVFAAQTWWGLIALAGGKDAPQLTATEVDALGVAADSLGAAVGRRQAELQLHRRNHELDVLNSVIAAATTTLEPHSVLETTCRELARAFNAPTAGAALIDESGQNLEIVAEYVAPGEFSAIGEKIPIDGNPSTQYVLKHKKPLVINNVQSDPRMASVRDLMRKRDVASIILLPLVADDEVVGTLGLDATEPNHFGDEEVALATSAVSAASQVLGKARLLTAEQENTARLEKILELSTELAGSRDEQQLLETLARRAGQFSRSGICTILMLSDGGEDLTIRAQHGLDDDVVGMTLPTADPLVQRALSSREPLLVANVDRDAPGLRRFLVRSDIQSFYAFPFVVDDRPIGFMTFSGLSTGRPSAPEVSALRLLAERTAAALQNVRLLNAVSSQAAQLAALHEVDVAISNSLEPEEVYHTITHSAALLLNCDLVNLYSWHPEENQLVGLATYGPAEKSVKGERFEGDLEPALPLLREKQKPLPIADATDDQLVDEFWHERMEMRAVLLVPLLYRDGLSGLLACNDTRQTRDWSNAEIELAKSLAAQAAIAVANARLHAETRALLKRSRQQARIVQQVVDTVPDGLLLLDPQNEVVVANPVAQAFLESLDAQSDDNSLISLGGEPLANLLQSPAGDRPYHELVVEGPQRRIFELSAQQMEVEPLAGGWVLVLHEATHERAQSAYLQAQDRLATVGQLAAGIAHDFNNILAVIVLYAQTLQHADIAAKDRERLRAIYQQAQRASSLISQILDFSRRSVVERQPLELLPFLQDLSQMLQRTLPETITLDLQVEHADAVVNVDPTRLQQALMNLALNARDAMPQGGALRITLSHHDKSWKPPLPDMAPGDWIAISVGDSGSGISADVLPHIFEPFFTTKAPGQGTGLGLAQVYGIVKQHDGFIDVHSPPGHGATFKIYLPAFEPAPASPADPQPSPSNEAGELILVVEDEPAIQNVVGEILELLNYRVLLASDGLEALQIYDEAADDIDLVLSDMVMPNMDGANLYRALREKNSDIKMVLFTGYPLDQTGKTFVEEEGVAWIQKPFTAEALDAIIRQTLDDSTP